MLVSKVAKLSPTARFLYWIKERHQIWNRRRIGLPKPWTDDEVLQNYFFTNPYRENDKVTVWFRDNVREPLRNTPKVILATVIFRWFNLPVTGSILLGLGTFPEGRNLLTNWDRQEALTRLRMQRELGNQIFTGAFMINSPPGKPKLEAICDRIENVWSHRSDIINAFDEDTTMEGCHEGLTAFDGLGGFMAYEIVCDLRYTKWLENARDKLTWCNPGPGCIRGLYRIMEKDFPKGNNSTSPAKPKGWLEQMWGLLDLATKKLPLMPPFELREIEHSLCEFDKYERIRLNDGRAKRRFNGVN